MAQESLSKAGKLPPGTVLEPCPVCGSPAELWQYSKDFKNGPISSAITCTNGDTFEPQVEYMGGEGCLLYLPPDQFYANRIKNAVEYWNTYAKAVCSQREANRIKDSKV